MKEQYGALFTMCTIGWIIEGFLIQTDTYVRKNDYGDLLCNEGQISTIQRTRNVLICAKACALHSSCFSFFYNRNKTCQLHNTIVYSTMTCTGVAETFYFVQKGKEAVFMEMSCKVDTYYKCSAHFSEIIGRKTVHVHLLFIQNYKA